jgi:hypothetical protein
MKLLQISKHHVPIHAWIMLRRDSDSQSNHLTLVQLIMTQHHQLLDSARAVHIRVANAQRRQFLLADI